MRDYKVLLEEFVLRNKLAISAFLIGTMIVGVGMIVSQSETDSGVEVLSAESSSSNVESNEDIIVVEIVGAVKSAGVYELPQGSRVNDLIEIAGGFENENKDWVERFVNRAAVLIDGQKLIIMSADEQINIESANNFSPTSNDSYTSGETQNKYVNINTASQSELESLWGIGPVYAKNIIEHRPYSSVSELTSKNIIKSNVYERNKDLLTVY